MDEFRSITFSLREKAGMRGKNSPRTALTLTLSRGEREKSAYGGK
jgi:hypothetical protein